MPRFKMPFVAATIWVFTFSELPFVKNEPIACHQCSTLSTSRYLPSCEDIEINISEADEEEDAWIKYNFCAKKCPVGPSQRHMVKFFEWLWIADLSAYREKNNTANYSNVCALVTTPPDGDSDKKFGEAAAGCVSKELWDCFYKISTEKPLKQSEYRKLCPKIKFNQPDISPAEDTYIIFLTGYHFLGVLAVFIFIVTVLLFLIVGFVTCICEAFPNRIFMFRNTFDDKKLYKNCQEKTKNVVNVWSLRSKIQEEVDSLPGNSAV